jgi:hypothetical protein
VDRAGRDGRRGGVEGRVLDRFDIFTIVNIVTVGGEE